MFYSQIDTNGNGLWRNFLGYNESPITIPPQGPQPYGTNSIIINNDKFLIGSLNLNTQAYGNITSNVSTGTLILPLPTTNSAPFKVDIYGKSNVYTKKSTQKCMDRSVRFYLKLCNL